MGLCSHDETFVFLCQMFIHNKLISQHYCMLPTYSPWGEHEIDYILFVTVPSKDELILNPNCDEVDDVRWVTQSKLLEMFDDTTLLFSPWFRIIANRWLIGRTDNNIGGENNNTMENGREGWWDDLDQTLTTDHFCDYGTIHRFDPPMEHMGGAGDAVPMFGSV